MLKCKCEVGVAQSCFATDLQVQYVQLGLGYRASEKKSFKLSISI